ncbi:Copine family protein [Trichomonas vaginalis G3]|uniref:Copine family protein n=1 Tax=Trichomonas vaginalis (strain ATCC PRA-98 / G3) TaxID=412133 RepID=A2EL99_TRIV3|nr:copine family [Trichomonas vaginalis G3]EAY06576.1 Copine family protein [Trichomonas vaginalis G3]KAI5538807.1 copine family [Trichomonas vaginalis G3]|eukprot:XP_001318799.1 Copine family protein [Trichomonas vaginalis G3]
MSIAYGAWKPQSIKSTNSGQVEVQNTSSAEVTGDAPIIDMHVGGKELKKMDIGSESDPMCVLFIPMNGRMVEVARTEVIWDNPNPQWVKVLRALYVFETNQPLRFCVYDCDSEKGDLSHHDFIGYCDTNVQHIVTNLGTEIVLELKHDTQHDKRGFLTIIAEQAQSCNSRVKMDFAFKNLKKVRTFHSNRPYLVISKPSETGKLLPTYRSAVYPKCNSCNIKTFEIPLQSLCNGDMDVPLTLSAYDFREGKLDYLIGSAQMSLKEMMENTGTELVIKNKGKEMGKIKIGSIQLTQHPTFVDYLRGGLQLNLITAIDFTASNGDPNNANSLHFINNQAPNQYETCIWSVGGVICPYDSDQKFPVFGFGGIVGGQVSHCFPLTFNPNDPNVDGLQGIIGAYRNSLFNVRLSGPTLFAPVIQAATGVARASFAESRTYTILLIITDGIINDMSATIDAIVAATVDAPLSIIIVGVGKADFEEMDRLDADEVPLRATNGQVMKRDIVQFVPFREFASRGGPALAAEVLEEVPRQVDEFCHLVNFVPTPAQPRYPAPKQ